MEYDVDDKFEFEEDEFGFPLLPDGVHWEGNLCILPNGKYLPCGAYILSDGGTLLYEPHELSSFGKRMREWKRAKAAS